MHQADFDVADFDGSKRDALDATLLVKFFFKTRQDMVESRKQNRPIFKEVEYIDIKIPGDRAGGICRPARQTDIDRFPKHYAAFKNRTAAPETGTPLAEWAAIPRTAIELLAFENVKTVEQLASLADDYAGRIQGGHGYKRQAKDFLAKAKLNADKDTVLQLQKENEELKTALQELTEKVESLSIPVKKKRKKPAKKKVVEKTEQE